MYSEEPVFRSRLSFLPLVKAWEQMAASGKTARSEYYAGLIQRFSQAAELNHPIDQYDVLKKYQPLVEEAIATIFANTLLTSEQLNAISPPFSNKIIHASTPFRQFFMEEETNELKPLDTQVAMNIRKARINLAYALILKNFYHLELAGGLSFICAYPDPAEEIQNYFELSWDPRFIEVSYSGLLSPLPENFGLHCHHVKDLEKFPGLISLLPLEQFIFDGILPIWISEVTERETSAMIRELLHEDPVLEHPESSKLFRDQMSYLTGIEKLEAGISSFHTFHKQNKVLPQPGSLLLQPGIASDDSERITGFILDQLKNCPYYLIRSKDIREGHPLCGILKNNKRTSLLFIALYNRETISGCLELFFADEITHLHSMIVKLQQVIPHLQLAIQRNERQIQQEIEGLILDHFTAVQPSVAWKFEEASINYILQSRQTPNPQMGKIRFDQVYPLYAAIDIRNSSTERNNALQRDVIQQLGSIKNIIDNARQQISFPIMEELASEIEEKLDMAEKMILTTGEPMMHSLVVDADEVLHYLGEKVPETADAIASYFKKLDGTSGLFRQNQQNFEASIAAINDYLSHFIDREQPDAQSIYPHYFDRFITDGADFNIFVGQSISPQIPFNLLYLKNLRLWQLKLLATAARYLNKLKTELPISLETTQLILVYNQPISISFRPQERKFDVDGLHHAQYEVVKKRIDKACIRNSKERLTKPGTIAIVYFNEGEAEEYLHHINHLKKEQFLEGDTEQLELEDLQGVNGIKALRVKIKIESPEEPVKPKKQPSLLKSQP